MRTFWEHIKKGETMLYTTREEEIRATISKEEAIRLIEGFYHARYDPNLEPNFDVYDQLLACEAIVEATPVKDYSIYKNTQRENANVSVNGNDNGGCKIKVNLELNPSKTELNFELINQLKNCNSSTPPKNIASLLERIFKTWESKEGHWLWIAQNYTARTINWVMAATIKEYLRGGIRKNPPSYFTYLIKFRKKRKQFRNTIGIYKKEKLVLGKGEAYEHQ